MSTGETFKRLEYKYNGPLALQQHDLSELTKSLKPTEYIVKVKAASLNPADLSLFNSHKYVFWKRNTKGIGRDFSGVVVNKGDKVDAFAVGDEVSGVYEPVFGEQGAFTEYLKVDTTTSPNVGKSPENLTAAEASSFSLVFGTAYTMLTYHKRPTKDSKVLIIGGGTSVAWYLIQLLKNYHGVEDVVTINSSKSAERVKSLGVTKIIDYTKGDVATQVLDVVKANGEKFDLILDTVGGKDLFPVIDDILKPKSEDSGYVTIVGDTVGNYNLSLFSYFTLGFIKKLLFPQPFNYHFTNIHIGGWYDFGAQLFNEGKLKPLIDSTYPLENFQAAVDRLKDHRSEGKVVLTINE